MLDSLTHHAYAIAGDGEEVIPQILSALERVAGFKPRGNPDFHSESYAVMGIDEARALKEASGRIAVSGGKKVFIVAADSITREAQNALLKVCEEPAADTHFFLVVPSFETLLPTLRSRLFVLSAREANGMAASSRAEAFLRAQAPARLKTVQELLKAADDGAGRKTFIAFLDELERAIAADTRVSKTQNHAGKRRAQALSELFRVKKYCHDGSPSFKLLLEHLALVLPKL